MLVALVGYCKNRVAAPSDPLLYCGGMKKAAVRTTTGELGVAGQELQQSMKALQAKQQFYGATLNMSWRLALTVVIPVVGGIKLDQHFGTTPSLTLTGFFLAVAGACVTVWGTVKEVNLLQAEEDKKTARRKKRA